MNKYILFLAVAASFIFNGCTKENSGKTVSDATGVSVQSISFPKFSNSSWNNVIGNTLLQFDLLGQNNTATSTIKDSVESNHLSGYYKSLAKGTYDIYISSKNLNSAADTFIRFNAQLKSYNVSTKQDLLLKVTSDDGLITIDQNLVHDNTIPIFKPETNIKAFKFGLINGFYYLYVKGGVKGSISFISKSNQTFTKNLSIAALTQYNVALQINNGSLQITFVPFVYNQVAVNSNTLITLNINPNNYLSVSGSTYFVVTDESGNILNEVKYIKGTSTFKISASQPYTKDRINFFQIHVPLESNVIPQILGFLQVKKGSVYTTDLPFLPGKETFPIKPHLINTNGFDQLTLSTGENGIIISSLADSLSLQQFQYPNNAKLYVRMLKDNKYTYNFFNIPKGTLNFNVDVSQLTKTNLTKTITAPGDDLQVQVYAKSDVNYVDFYLLENKYTSSNQIDIYYPSETFPEYDVLMNYRIGDLSYNIATTSTTIPDKAAAFNASFKSNGSSLTNFVPSWSGKFDYYRAEFQNDHLNPTLDFTFFSPSAANYTNIKLPDFSKYLGVSKLDLNSFSIKSFGLYQFNGFDETKFFYKDGLLNYQNFNGKSVIRNYW
ncbi:hypothetical protein [Mucilaginibacter pocheonensis]|uniref:GOLD domain-containing protein n=1 Tax=Mucilaginibacter pocheonensis TaxID=398050 RepID=A0ABU1T632_9SPHI|nr:hypothetical protein [Mucilaginibacter pocheonensis]MDR6940706.1 hypothetical protein [Mucilaginibacter pocheonensis]